MGYGDLSHTEVIISHEAKLSGIYETEVWDKSHIHGWLLDEYFILSKGNFKQNKTSKNLAMGYGNLSNGIWEFMGMGIYPMAISQSEHYIFP